MKKIVISLTLILTITPLISATPYFIFNADLNYSFDTNIFSDPLPTYEKPDSNGNLHWLPYRYRSPFKTTHNIGFSLGFAYFTNDSSRIGLSSNINLNFPIYRTTVQPIPNSGNVNTDDLNDLFKKDWNYVYSFNKPQPIPAAFFSIGPIFKASFTNIDLGISVRLSIGGYEYTDNEVIIGVQAEPFIMYKPTENIGINLKLTLNSQLMRFIESDQNKFDENYQMVTLSPSIGISYIL